MFLIHCTYTATFLFLQICLNGHEAMSWASQPILPNSAMLGNFKFCSAIVLSGNNYRKIALLCKFLRVGIPSKTSFDNLQRNYIVPEVNKYWTTMKQTTQEKLRALDVVAAGMLYFSCIFVLFFFKKKTLFFF